MMILIAMDTMKLVTLRCQIMIEFIYIFFEVGWKVSFTVLSNILSYSSVLCGTLNYVYVNISADGSLSDERLADT
jgi:hypothetical protein